MRPEPGRFVIPATDGPNDVTVVEATDWRDLAGTTGAAWVAPVLVDDSGAQSYPTGEVTVRFTTAPSAATLAELEVEVGVRLVRRNEFVAEQVVLEPTTEGPAYLPDVCAALERREDVRTAWLSTKSAYRRS